MCVSKAQEWPRGLANAGPLGSTKFAGHSWYWLMHYFSSINASIQKVAYANSFLIFYLHTHFFTSLFFSK